MSLRYLHFDLMRALRNTRVMIFTLVTPLLLFAIFGSGQGDQTIGGISAAAYVMVSMAMFGSMSGALSSGGTIAFERGTGWNRTLRLTPLRSSTYVASKVVLSLLLAVPPLVLVFAAGVVLDDVRLSAAQWFQVAATAWLGALPFAALGIVIGYVATPDSVQPISALTTILVAAFGGLWIPVEQMPGWMHSIAELTPAYWTGLTSRSALTTTGLDTHALWVVLLWTAGLAAIGLRLFRAEAARA
ncbi:MAG TPA: ABC transporter permease [Nocardioidaceae bacterium]|nr:ABC transporter permease [Nocardioidaceae bacterium]